MKEYNEQVVETLDDAGCIIANKNIIIDNLQVRIAELEAENELLKGRKNVELAANTDNAKSKQQRELAGPMEMGQLLAGSTHKTSGDLEIERTKPVTWIHKGGGFISDSRGKFIGCFSGDFRYRDRIICAVNSESETSKQLASYEQRVAGLEEENARLKAECDDIKQVQFPRKLKAVAAGWKKQLAAEQLNNKLLRDALEAVIKVHGYESGIPVEALAQPSDTSALDAYVAEKVKDVQLQDIEQYLLQMAGISTAAIGYWKEDDSILPAYDTPALRDVAKLYANYESRTRQRDLAVEALHYCVKQFPELATVPGIATTIKESEAK